MKNGSKIDVDDMDVDHLRNTLKMIIRVIESKRDIKRASRRSFTVNGELAQEDADRYDLYKYGLTDDEDYI